MMRIATVLAVLALATGCPQSTLPSPFDGQVRYLCCNLHYEKTTVADVNFQQGTLVPLGTRVTITKVRGQNVTFEAPNLPPITVALKYGRRELAMDTFVNRLFVEQDPKLKLKNLPKKTRELIEAGQVEKGMTRDQVLMSLGYPPAHRTPSLESPQWTYWQNRWQTFVVDFDSGRVDTVRR
jgi:hypothetical protein